MMWAKLKAWALARLAERSTWRGIAWVALAVVVLGASLLLETPRYDQVERAATWIAAGLGFAGAGEIVRKERG